MWLSVRMYVCLCVYQSVCSIAYVSLFVWVWVVWVRMPVYICLCLPACLFDSLCLTACIGPYVSLCLSMSVFICLFNSLCLIACMGLYVSLCLSIFACLSVQ